MLAILVMSDTEAIQAGRNPANLDNNELYSEQILELEPVGANQANIVWEWNIKDHLIQDFDNTKDNFGVVADNAQLLDINFLNGNSPVNNWLHFNSIQYNEQRDQIVISSRKMSELYIIDHSTTTAEAATSSGGTYGKGGDLLYRWGNPEAYGNGLSTDRKLFGQHTPYFIPESYPNGGKIMTFNNGIDRTPSYSQVDIISPPESSLGIYDYTLNTAYLPNATDYTYDQIPSSGVSDFFTSIVSNAQQLPNGNILICEGRKGYFFELNTNDEKVWEYISPINRNNGTTIAQGDPAPTQSSNLTFRAIKYPLDYTAFNGRDLTPNGTLELNPDFTPCNNLSVDDYEQSIINIYPNPSNGVFNVNSLDGIDKIEAYNTLGKKVYETITSNVNLSEQANGLYFLKIYSNSNVVSKKVIKN
jgi:hypothetical protein